MNGRVYDYNVGRFMSVDPVIQSPGNSQSINPYSYIMNNPLAGTDPTGYTADVEVEIKVKVKTGARTYKTETVKATVSTDGSGGVEISFSGDNSNGSVGAAKGSVSKSLQGAGFKVSDIEGQTAVSANLGKLPGTSSASMESTAQKKGFTSRIGRAIKQIDGAEKVLSDPFMAGTGFAKAAVQSLISANDELSSVAHDLACAMDECGLELSTPILNVAAFGEAANVARVAMRGAFNQSAVVKTAEAAADAAAANGKVSGAAAELKVGNRTFTAVSGESVQANPQVTGALMGTPRSARKPWHGGCAEVGCLDKAFNAGVNPAGGAMRAVNIGISGSGHGTSKKVCSSCQDLLNHFNVDF